MSKSVCHTTSEELLDRLALHATGLLDQAAAAELEGHLAEGCEACNKHLVAFREAFAAVGHAVPTAYPPPHVRDRLMNRIGEASVLNEGAQVWKAWREQPASGVHIVRSNDEHWESVHPGIRAKRLYVDTTRDTVTMLIRMDPAASYIPHRHGGPEQCFVLEGDLHDGDLVVTAGDFQCAAEGSVHGAQWTTSGCLLLIVSSLKDELL
jgi:anti-sigma factor ChrR (cupin superfamily)